MTHVWVIAPEGLPIPPRNGGSVQIYTHALLQSISQNPNLAYALVSPGNKETRTNTETYSHITISGQSNSYFRQVLRHLRREQPDIVQIENRPQYVKAVRQTVPKAKIVLNLHSTTFLNEKIIKYPHARWVLKNVDRVVCNSKYLKAKVGHKFVLKHNNWKPVVIYPGVDIASFSAPSANSMHQPIRLLYVGRIIKQKGLDVILRSLKILHRKRILVELTVIGRTPPWEEKYERAIRYLAKNLPVNMIGFVPPHQLPKYYHQADVFLCPSQRNEAFGLVNLEAMAAGVPVIASRVGGIREVVTTKSGELISNYHDPSAFAKAIHHLISNPDYWRQLSNGAKERALQFTWKQTASQFETLYRSLCN